MRQDDRPACQRDGDQEDALPAEMADQEAAQGRADHERQTVAACPDSEGAAALGRIRPDHAHDGQGGRQQHRRADAHYGPCGDQDADVRGKHAHDGRQCDHAGASLEDEAAAAEVGAKAAAEKQDGVGQVVGIQDPLERCDRGVERRTDLLRGEVDDRGIDLGDQHPKAQRHEDCAAPAGGVHDNGDVGCTGWHAVGPPVLSDRGDMLRRAS